MERIASNKYRLSSGREVYANHGLVGISDQRGTEHDEPSADGFELSEGYDGSIAIDGTDWRADPPPDAWSAAERIELAEFMIAQWQAFKASVRN